MLRKAVRNWAICLVPLLLLLSTGCQEHLQLAEKIVQGGQLVIISLGDSYASGEGNPDSFGPGGALWLLSPEADAMECHRSYTNAHRLAAIETAEEWTYGEENVVFKSFACTGATIRRGILGPHFAGPAEVAPGELPLCMGLAQDPVYCTRSQLDLAQEWRDDPANGILDVDVVLITVGGNDVGFGHLIAACAMPPLPPFVADSATFTQPCDRNPFVQTLLDVGCTPGPSPICLKTGTDLNNPHIVGLNGLAAELDQLFAAVQERLQPKHILLVSYPDPSRDYQGNFCDKWDDGFVVGLDAGGSPQPGGTTGPILGLKWPVGAATKEVVLSESRWAYNNVVVRLNNILEERAAANGVIFVDGAAEATRHHGFCAVRQEAVSGGVVLHQERWFRTFKDSYEFQGDVQGTMHPNQLGHQALASLIAAALRDVLAIGP